MSWIIQRARLSFAISTVDFTKVKLKQKILSFKKKKEYIAPPLQLYVKMLIGKHVQDEKLTDFPDFRLKKEIENSREDINEWCGQIFI